jgi:hypothetical protein
VADRRIIVVLGATGAPGAGLADTILKNPDGGFAARASRAAGPSHVIRSTLANTRAHSTHLEVEVPL